MRTGRMQRAAQTGRDKNLYRNRCDGFGRRIDNLVYGLCPLKPDEIRSRQV